MLQCKCAIWCSPEPESSLVIWETSAAVCSFWKTMTPCSPREDGYTFWRFHFIFTVSEKKNKTKQTKHHSVLQLIHKKTPWNINRRCRNRNKRRNKDCIILLPCTSVAFALQLSLYRCSFLFLGLKAVVSICSRWGSKSTERWDVLPKVTQYFGIRSRSPKHLQSLLYAAGQSHSQIHSGVCIDK